MHTPRLGEGPKILGEREIMKEKVTEEGSLLVRLHKYAGAHQSMPLHTGWLKESGEGRVRLKNFKEIILAEGPRA